MSQHAKRLASGSVAVAVIAAFLIWQPAEARGWGARGAHGAAGGWARQGAYGQSAGWGAHRYGQGAIGAAGGRWTGANGGTLATGGGGAFKRGVGGVWGTGTSATGPGGSTYNGYHAGKYNAQTGQGTWGSGKQVYDAKNGQTYGYTGDTQYQKGQGGVTQIDTNHKGDYTVDWGGGQKTTVTKDTPTGQ